MHSGHGDVTAANLDGGVNINSNHGDVHLSVIKGSVQVHFSTDKGDFSAHQVDGDLTAEGNCNDLTLSEIKGKVTINGELFGDVHMENVNGPIHVHTSVTDMDVAALPGDLTLNPDNLRVTQAKGQVRVTTHSKDVDLSQVYGDSYVEDRDGRIAIETAGNYAVDARNLKGDVEVTLPPNAAASVTGSTRNGDIVTDFPLAVSGDESKSVSGKIGAGGPKVTLTAENGDIHIKRGDEVPGPPPTVAGPAVAKRAAFESAEGPARTAGNAVSRDQGTGNKKPTIAGWDVGAECELRAYSVLRACIGSRRDARHAGTRQAIAATVSRVAATAAKTAGSNGRSHRASLEAIWPFRRQRRDRG